MGGGGLRGCRLISEEGGIDLKYLGNELDVCKVDAKEFDQMLTMLGNKIGPSVVARIRSQQQLSVELIKRVYVCSVLVESLHEVLGFARVAKSIRSDKYASPTQPYGEWFQLMVAYILKWGNLDLGLEQEMNNLKRDILVASENLVIECKYFTSGLGWQRAFESFHATGLPPEVPQDLPPEFTRTMFSVGSCGMSPPIQSNDFYRFVGNALEEKAHQFSDKVCNLLAFNPSGVAGGQNPFGIAEKLQELLEEPQYELVSGFLLLESEHLREHHERGALVRLMLVERRKSNGYPIPASLHATVEKWMSKDIQLPNSTTECEC